MNEILLKLASVLQTSAGIAEYQFSKSYTDVIPNLPAVEIWPRVVSENNNFSSQMPIDLNFFFPIVSGTSEEVELKRSDLLALFKSISFHYTMATAAKYMNAIDLTIDAFPESTQLGSLTKVFRIRVSFVIIAKS
jgi:hypothetical protein